MLVEVTDELGSASSVEDEVAEVDLALDVAEVESDWSSVAEEAERVAEEDDDETEAAERAAVDDAPEAVSSVVLSKTLEVDVLERERREEDEVVELPPVVGRDEVAAADAELGEVEERERDRREEDELEDDPSAVETGKSPLFCSKWNTAKLRPSLWSVLGPRPLPGIDAI